MKQAQKSGSGYVAALPCSRWKELGAEPTLQVLAIFDSLGSLGSLGRLGTRMNQSIMDS